MKRFRAVGIASLAALAFAVVMVTEASAEGPLWVILGYYYNCVELSTPIGSYKDLPGCLAGTTVVDGLWERKTSFGFLHHLEANQGVEAEAKKKTGTGNFKLKTSLIAIECTTLTAPTILIGGVPAKDSATIAFGGCSVEGKTEAECHVHSPGEPVGSIDTTADTEVIYLGSEKEAEKEEGKLGDLFTPESGETFVELDVEGSKCPIFTKGEQEVKGSVIGEIKPVNTVGKTGELIFPSSSIKSGFRWTGKGKVKKVEAKLSVFSVVEALQIGEAEVMLKSEEEWGGSTT